MINLERAQREAAARVLARKDIPHPSGLVTEESYATLEQTADWMLQEDRQHIRETDRSLGAVHGILLEYQLKMRQEREVLVSQPDPGLVSGLYRRAYAPKRKTRDKKPPPDYRREVQPGHSTAYQWGISRDPGMCPLDKRYHDHLDRYQRSRIRAAMRRVPESHKELARLTLALKYGVKPYTITRLCGE